MARLVSHISYLTSRDTYPLNSFILKHLQAGNGGGGGPLGENGHPAESPAKAGLSAGIK